jgi:hypothetical protein
MFVTINRTSSLKKNGIKSETSCEEGFVSKYGQTVSQVADHTDEFCKVRAIHLLYETRLKSVENVNDARSVSNGSVINIERDMSNTMNDNDALET